MNILLTCHNLELNGSNMFNLILSKNLSKSFPDLHINLFPYNLFDKKRLPSNYRSPILDLWKESNINFSIRNDLSKLNDSEINNYEIIIINTLICSQLAKIIKQKNKKYLLIVHEPWGDSINNNSQDNPNIWGWDIKKEDIKYAIKNAYKVIFPSKYVMQQFNNGKEENNFKTVYNPIHIRNISKENQYKLGTNYLHIGALSDRKNQKLSLLAFKKIIETNKFSEKKLKIDFIGARDLRLSEIKYKNELQNLIQKFNLEEKVSIKSVEMDKDRLFSNAKLLLCPSKSEVTPYVILEAINYGIPFIASNINGIPEITPKSNLCRLINDYKSADELFENIKYVEENLEKDYESFLISRDLLLQKHDHNFVIKEYMVIIKELLQE